jgi:phage shock protein E
MNMTTKTILLVAAMGILSAFIFGKDRGEQADIPALIKNGALVIDARSPGEFDTGHIQGAVNIPHNVIDRQISGHAKSKDASIVVYCHSGMRSGHARKVLLHMGYTQVVNGGSLHHMRKIIEN